MNNHRDRFSLLTGLTVMLLAANPALAAENSITGVNLKEIDNKLELKLTTKNNAEASFFTVRNQNTIEANLLDTELELPEGDRFEQTKPFPGIDSVEITKVDKENTKVVVTTEKDFDLKQLQQQEKEILLSLERSHQPNKLQELGKKAIDTVKQTYNSAFGSDSKSKDEVKPAPKLAQNTTSEIIIDDRVEDLSNSEPLPASTPPEGLVQNNTEPDVLVPNPDVEITGGNQNLPTLPRAVAPPVGDMAVSNIDASPDIVDLGSETIVPRLVLRDAPVREVLSILAREAGLDIVFSLSETEGAPTNEEGEVIGPTVSLDLENQSVQEAFNSVLLVSNLNANRKGNIIYIGDKLPPQARNLISRTLRLNQVRAENAALYLASQGAQGKRLTTEVEETIDPETGRVVQRVELPATLENLDGGLEDEDGTQALLLQGLQVSTDDRLNSITLVGEPRKVEVATSFLTQLDARRRQVAVNVKVIDVNLLNQDAYNSSFSFGINDTFFVQDNGSAILNFGDTAPPNAAQVNSSQFFPTIAPLQVGEAELAPFFDIQENTPFNEINPGFNEFTDTTIPYARPNFGKNNNPFQPGLSDVNIDSETGQIEYEYSLPSLFQFPDSFLSQLEARVTNGNAKILTDPTLMVQEGQQATVKLAQNIVESVETSIDAESGARTITPVIGEAGVVLTVNIERIDDNGFISLSVSPTVSSVGQTQEFDSGGGATNILNLLSKRELSSGLVRLRDGQTLILSGIIQDQERTTVSKVPILGDIPLLGSLFRSTDKANERAEVIVLLTPEVVDEDSNFGYDYTPGKESRELLRENGVGLPGNP